MLHSNFSLHILQLGQVQSLFCQIHTPDLKVYKTLEEDTTFLLEARAETCIAASHTECPHHNYSIAIGPYFGIVTKAVKSTYKVVYAESITFKAVVSIDLFLFFLCPFCTMEYIFERSRVLKKKFVFWGKLQREVFCCFLGKTSLKKHFQK